MKQDNQNEILFELLYLLERIGTFFAVFGRCLSENFRKGTRKVFGWYKRNLTKAVKMIGHSFAVVGKWFSRVFAGVGNIFMAFWHTVMSLKEDLSLIWNANTSLSVKERLKQVASYFWGSKKKRKHFMVTTLNYVMPVVAVVIAVNMISGLLHTNYAFAVTYNGVELGYIEDETVYSDAAKDLQSRIIVPEDGETVSVDAKLSLRALNKEDKMVTPSELTNRMMQNADQDIMEAEGVYVDGKFVGAVKEIGAVDAYLDEVIKSYIEETGYDSASFVKDIQTEEGYFVADNIVSYEDMKALLDSEESTDQYYTVKTGDTPIGIAAQFDVNYKDLIKWNPKIESELYVDDKILVGVSEPYLSITATTTDVYTTALKYDTVKEESDSMPIGEKKVKQEGQNGEQTITAEVTLLNGYETERKIVEEKITKQPVKEIVVIGTKEPDPVTVPSTVSTNSGNNNTGTWLSWPTNGGYISSGFGSRWGSFHRAIDIAKVGGCYGDSIFAAADGVVTYAGTCGTFGNLIKVSHGNGLETWYAHCSGFNVSVGQSVSRGTTIGYIGNTGRSTGPHLHFQVMLHGQYVNPINYLK